MKELRRSNELPRFGQPRRRGRARRDPLPPSLRPRAARAEPVPAGRWAGSRRDPVVPWQLLVSLLAHMGVLALLLIEGSGGQMADYQPSPPSVDIVFESSRPDQRSSDAQGDPSTLPEAPAQSEAPPPVLVEPPPTPPEPPRVAELPPAPVPLPPTPPRIAPPPQATIPPPPPDPAAEPRPIQPMPRLSAEIPPPTVPPDLLSPQTPLELAQPRVQPAPRPTPRPESRPRPQVQAQPSPRLPGLYLPEGPSFSTPRPPPGRPDGTRQRFDLAVNPRFLEGRAAADPTVRVRGAQVGPDWNGAFRRWLDQHLHYPLRAIQEGDSGTVRVMITANPDGTVRSVRLTGASASPFLNTGTTMPFAGARLPAFPAGSDPNGVEVDLTVNYILIRR